LAIAVEKGDLLARARIINIAANVTTDDAIDIDSAVTLDVDLTYMFGNNFDADPWLLVQVQAHVSGFTLRINKKAGTPHASRPS
jgi:outer membrane protein W